MNFSFLQFLSPFMLGFLLLLPALWWLLKIIPPKPKHVKFAGTFLLKDIKEKDHEKRSMPLWLLLLRMAIITLFIIAFAGPFYNNQEQTDKASAPISIIIIDNGWSAAQNWSAIKSDLTSLSKKRALENEETLYLLTTTKASNQALEPKPLNGLNDIAGTIETLSVNPWQNTFIHVQKQMNSLTKRHADFNLYYMDDGYLGEQEIDFLNAQDNLNFYTVKDATALIMIDKNTNEAPSIYNALNSDDVFRDASHRLVKSRNDAIDQGTILLNTRANTNIPSPFEFAEDETRHPIKTGELPEDIADQVKALSIQGQNHLGGSYHFTQDSAPKTIGLLGNDLGDKRDFLNGYFYIDKALSPFHTIIYGDVNALTDKADVIIMTDTDLLTENTVPLLESFMTKGGIVIRFADDDLADGKFKELSPVTLRTTNRQLGSSFSWETPQKISHYNEETIFNTLPLSQDITITRQLLAEPSLALQNKSWAFLEDGTPIITATEKENGWLFLYHSNLDPAWSNLALSGVFQEQLKKIVTLSYRNNKTSTAQNNKYFYVTKRYTGFGELQDPKGYEARITTENTINKLSDTIPPGVYSNGFETRILQLSDSIKSPPPVTDNTLSDIKSTESVEYYGGLNFITYKHLLMILALLFITIEAFWYCGFFKRLKAISVVVVMLFVGFTFHTTEAHASQGKKDSPAYLSSHAVLAYVITGDATIDRLSKFGLEALVRETKRRTIADVEAVKGINIERDVLNFYPFIYWPLTNTQQPVSKETAAKINNYVSRGGTIFFDTRDGYAGETAINSSLQSVISNLPIPTLNKLSDDHVLKRSFYIIKETPGLYDRKTIWYVPTQSTDNDGVTPYVIGGNDWASIWATDPAGRPMTQLKNKAYQRELAYRFGVNMVLYALTGNYKDDQIHIPFILERLER